MKRVLAWVAAGLVAGCAGAARAAEDANAGLALARMTLIDLRLQRELERRDHEIAQILLGVARRFEPDEPELVRFQIEAASNAGRGDLVLSLTRDLVRLDPRDTVAQLRLITTQIAGRQTAGERLEVYERLTGDRGAQLDDALRSRLALDGALLAREMGRGDQFRQLLTRAVELDPTNKEAASVALTYYTERVGEDAAGTADLLINLLVADPLDPNVLNMLYEHAMKWGAFDAAYRLNDLLSGLLVRLESEPDEMLRRDRLVLLWQLAGPERVVEALNGELVARRHEARLELARAEAQGLPTDEITPPDQVRLSLPDEQLRIFAAKAMGDEETLDAAYQDLAATVQRGVQDLTERQRGANPLPVQEAQAAVARLLFERFVLQALIGRQAMELDVGLGQLREAFADQPQVLMVLEMWADVANGRFDAAIARGEGLDAQQLPLPGLVAMVEAYRGAGRQGEAMEMAAVLARREPGTSFGAWAFGLIQRGSEERLALFPETDEVRRRILQLPEWLEEMAADPTNFLTLSAEIVQPTLGAMGEARLRVRVRNTGRIPLAVGGNRPIDSSLLLSPRLIVGTEEAPIAETPEVVSLARRLRLLPREELVLELWADSGFTGLYAQLAATQTVRARWRLLQSFMFDGNFRVGPMGVSTNSEVLLRTRFDDPDLPPAEIARRVAEGEGDAIALAGLVRSRVVAAPEGERLGGEGLEAIAAAFASGYASRPPRERALLLATLPHARQAPEMEAFDRAALDAETDPGLLMAALLLRAGAADDPAFDRALASDDASLREVAGLLRARLGEENPTGAALVAPGLASLYDIPERP